MVFLLQYQWGSYGVLSPPPLSLPFILREANGCTVYNIESVQSSFPAKKKSRPPREGRYGITQLTQLEQELVLPHCWRVNSYWTDTFGLVFLCIMSTYRYKRYGRSWCYLVAGGESLSHCIDYYCLYLILPICTQTVSILKSCKTISLIDFLGWLPIISYKLSTSLSMQIQYLNKSWVFLVEVVMLVTVVITAVNSKPRSVWPREG